MGRRLGQKNKPKTIYNKTIFKRTDYVSEFYSIHKRIKLENSIIKNILQDIKERKQKLLIRLAIKEERMTAKELKRIIRKLSNLPQNKNYTPEQMKAMAIEERKRITRRDNAIARYKKMGLSIREIAKLIETSPANIFRFLNR